LTKSKKEHPFTRKDASEESVTQKKPLASRHLLLIRHGHFNVDGETDDKRTLSPLGNRILSNYFLKLKQLLKSTCDM